MDDVMNIDPCYNCKHKEKDADEYPCDKCCSEESNYQCYYEKFRQS
jgi:hypothetical protein